MQTPPDKISAGIHQKLTNEKYQESNRHTMHGITNFEIGFLNAIKNGRLPVT